MAASDHPQRSAAASAALALAVLLGAQGCSTQQAYAVGQSWQRNECRKLPDEGARTRCLEAARLDSESYRRQSEALSGRAPQN